MTFFVNPFPASVPPESSNEYLGLFFSNPRENTTKPWPPTVAVEFDTWHNPGVDPPGVGDHFGINVNNKSSISIREVPNMRLYGTMWAEIAYDAGSKMITVSLRLADGSTYRDRAPVDLRAAGLPQDAAVGFSAARGAYWEAHQILSWSFNSTDVADLPATTDPVSKTKSSVIILYVGCSLAAVLLAALVYMIYYRRKKSRRRMMEKEISGRPKMEISPDVAKEFSYDELCAATEAFSEGKKIGSGSFGEVFRGVLCEQPVAVKKLTYLSEQTRKGYVTEIKTLVQLNHRNLVKFVGWCDGGIDNDKLLLVYELIKNGSLDDHLHGPKRLLTWAQRYKIVLGIARGIVYLHTGSHKATLHRDIKPSNVMLDDDFEAKLCDFGLVRQVDPGEYLRGTAMIGSWDYIDPLCTTTNEATTASDMYSFGVLLLEVATGRKPKAVVTKDRVLSNALIDDVTKGTVLELADKRLNGDFDQNEMERVLAVGLRCVQWNRNDRPDISEAINMLRSHQVPQTMDGMATLTEG